MEQPLGRASAEVGVEHQDRGPYRPRLPAAADMGALGLCSRAGSEEGGRRTARGGLVLPVMAADVDKGKGVVPVDNTIKIKVTQDSYLNKKVGASICFDLLDYSEPTYCMFSSDSLACLKKRIETDYQIQASMQRLWIFSRRHNNTYRPMKMLSSEDDEKLIGDLEELVGEHALCIYLEVELGFNDQPVHPLPKGTDQAMVFPLPKGTDQAMVFFKFLDVKRNTFRFVGRRTLVLANKPGNILEKLRDLSEIPPGEDLLLFEILLFASQEICCSPKVSCKMINLDISFYENKIQDGDIIWIQTASKSENRHEGHNVVSFLQYMLKKKYAWY